MKRALCLMAFLMIVSTLPVRAGMMDDLLKGTGLGKTAGPGNDQIVAGLKEALTIGTGKAVGATSKPDGYFGNKAIRILMPKKIDKVADVLGKIGYQKEVDEFVLSMNRAAEKAAPQAKEIFIDAIRGMSIEDARKILDGGDTAATEYFKARTTGKLTEAFRPIVSSSMNEVGTTRSYKEMMGKYLRPAVRQVRVAGPGPVRHRQGAGRALPHGGAGGDQDPQGPRRQGDRPAEDRLRRAMTHPLPTRRKSSPATT